MNVWEILGWASLAFLPIALLVDLFYRANRMKTPRFWRLKGFLVTMVSLSISIFTAETVGGWVSGSLFDLSDLGAIGGGLVGIVAYNFVHYAFHRFEHGNHFMWRASHQFHHATESFDAFGATWVGPIDSIMFTLIPVLSTSLLLGITLEAALIVGAFAAFSAAFQHMNIRTPRWLGYFVQRPESHAMHHQRGVHRYNYADLPLVDMIFGTFRNPEGFPEECGYYHGASDRVIDLLIGVDVAGDVDSKGTRALYETSKKERNRQAA